MATIHISVAEAARDFAALIERVSAGEEIVIESNERPVARLSAPQRKGRSISEMLALSKAYTEKLGYEPVMDAEFADDMREIIANRKPRDMSAWD